VQRNRPAKWIALVSLAVSAAPLACAGPGTRTTESVWVREDGTAVSPEAVRAVEAECDRIASEETRGRSARYLNIEWAAAKRRCMAEKGFVLTARPAE
jgi:hypothetical protein